MLKVPKEHFKIYLHYPEEEWSNPSHTFWMANDGMTLTVKLGRVLQPNEHNLKVYLFKLDEPPPTEMLLQHVVAKGQTVGQIKREILFKAKKLHMMDISVNKCRLREKHYKRPRKVYLDDQLLDDLLLNRDCEIYLQVSV